MSGSASGGEPSWAWLGLLKWSLSYTDGTRPSSETMQMSEENRKFLETVMKEGIVDEGERMKTILTDLTKYLDRRKVIAEGQDDEEEKSDSDQELSTEHAVGLLSELRDIVEQIDYAKAFSALGGVPFLVGCASADRKRVPLSVRSSCVAVFATLTQNNPHVQQSVLEGGVLQTLADVFFAEIPTEESANKGSSDTEVCDTDGKMRSRIVQAMSCSVRGHREGERAFCSSEGGRQVIEVGLGVTHADGLQVPPAGLRRRCLFFLQALLTSDDSTKERIELFDDCVRHVCANFLSVDSEPDFEIREMALSFLQRMVEQGNNVLAISQSRDSMVSIGIKRIGEVRKMEGDDREFASYELELWEALIVQLAKI